MNFRTLLLTSAMPLRAPEGDAGGGDAPAATVDGGAADDGVDALDLPDLMDGAASTVDGANGDDTVKAGEGADTVEGGKADDKAPEGVPEKYEVTPPEGFEALDEKALEAATPLLQKLGLKTNEAAQEVVNEFAKTVLPGILEQHTTAQQQAFQDTIVATRKAWVEEVKADPELAPDKTTLDANLAKAAKARDHFSTPELREFLKETGIGNHKEVIRLFAKIGDAISEGTFHRQDGSSQEKTEPWQRAYSEEFHPKA